MATPNQIDQQRRVISATRADVAALLELLTTLHGKVDSYNRLGLADDQILSAEAFAGTGADAASYRAAILSVEAILALLPSGHGTNLEQFGR